MAPEVIGLSKGSEEHMQMYGKPADMYSFGILVAAVLLETTRPWGPDLSDVDILFRVRQGGERPQIDDQQQYHACKMHCERNFVSQQKTNEQILDLQKIMELMRRCWSQDPLQRPSFAEVCQQLK
jgi:serine/threonine protein kinase